MNHLLFPRNRTADLLKGVAVILMIQVHIMELFARQDIFESLIGRISLFLGGPPAAPVFMAVMGYFIAKSNKTFRESFVRGLKIIILGFALNIGLNLHLFINISRQNIDLNPLPYLFGVDILFLAGLSIIVLSAVKLAKSNQLLYSLLALVLIFILQFIFKNGFEFPIENYILAYFYGEGVWWSYFPFIPWLAYPLIGFIYCKMESNLKVFTQKYLLYILIAYTIVVLIFSQFGMMISSNLDAYYHHDFMFFIYVIFFLIAWSAFAYIITGKYSNIALSYIEWLGKNVTSAYVIQWLLIGNIATALYKTQNLTASVLWFFGILLFTSTGVWLWTNRSSAYKVG